MSSILENLGVLGQVTGNRNVSETSAERARAEEAKKIAYKEGLTDVPIVEGLIKGVEVPANPTVQKNSKKMFDANYEKMTMNDYEHIKKTYAFLLTIGRFKDPVLAQTAKDGAECIEWLCDGTVEL